jgi:D-3-phosphoglycerate dehydrogenase
VCPREPVPRHSPRACQRVRDNNFELEGLEGFELKQKTVGVFGTGAIGTQVVRNLSGFGCRILAHDPVPQSSLQPLARYVSQAEILRESDILTFHVPLLPATRHLVTPPTLNEMKRGVILINTSRAGLIAPGALVAALDAGRPSMAGVDVYEQEPLTDTEDPLINHPNAICTPHLGYVTREEYDLQFTEIFEQIEAFTRGAPINVVNPAVLAATQ